MAHAATARLPRPRLNRALALAGTLLLVAGLGLKAYQIVAAQGRPVNVLVLGVDGSRSDVVVLAHWEPRYRLLNLVSIPRDTRVEIPCPKESPYCISPDKLAHAHHYGQLPDGRDLGPQLAVATVERFLGVKIDYYVRIDYEGFRRAIDALGGVTLDVEKDMDYDDPYQNLHIHLKKGVQHLDGKRALEYVRFRDDGLGDIGRIGRTHRFFQALLQSARQSGALRNLPALVSQVWPYVKTNVDLGTALALARAAQDLKPENLRSVTIPGQAIYKDNLWYWDADPVQKAAIVRDYITHVQPPPGAGR